MGIIKKHFGSLCYAGFILGLVEKLRDRMENATRNKCNPLTYFLFCILNCLF